jgi:hypothetical protein
LVDWFSVFPINQSPKKLPVFSNFVAAEPVKTDSAFFSSENQFSRLLGRTKKPS